MCAIERNVLDRQGESKRGREFFDWEELKEKQALPLKNLIHKVYNKSGFYRRKMDEAGIKPEDIRCVDDLAHLPFTTKTELRDFPIEYLRSAAEEEIVRIHSSSGTTGKPVIIPYTKNDVQNFAEFMARCMELAGVTTSDRVQITPGYGLWTAGVGFQAGVERLGAMAIPMGPGNTEKQLEMMVYLKSTVLTATASYGLLLAEEIKRRGLKEKIRLRTGIFGSERWGEKMRDQITKILDIETFDIYGLTEVYGPGIALDCPYHRGLHFWSDHLIFEIIDPASGKVLPPGEKGELVITTLTKEGLPLLRYRTHDITRLLLEACPCGSPYPMIERILGRSDEAFKVKGVLVFPGQIDTVLKETPGIGSEYQVFLSKQEARDHILVKVEYESNSQKDKISQICRQNIKKRIGILADIEVVPHGSLPRSEKKTKRIFDSRPH